MLPTDVLFTGLIVIFTVVCLVTDVRSGRIPNWLTVPTLGLGLVAHTVRGGLAAQSVAGGWDGLLTSLAGFGVGFGILFVMWLFRGAGGGDVKMMGALGAWLGALLTVEAFVASAVVDVIIVFVALFRGVVPERISLFGKSHKADKEKKSASSANSKKSPGRRGRILPYALPLSVGTWAVLAFAWWKNGGLF
jgi:prepilin peptidase CpaA